MNVEDQKYYPPKPEVNEKNSSSITKTILSLLLFTGLFFIINIPANFIFLIVLVVFLHELGHLFAMKRFGYEDVGMFFVPFLGAMVTGRKERMKQSQKIIITLAGPIPGLIIGVLILMFTQGIDDFQILQLYGIIFIALNAINLIPLDPLDGGRLFEALFFSFNETTKMIFTIISALLMLIFGLLYTEYLFILLGIFMFTRVATFMRHIKLKKLILKRDVNLNQTYEELSDREFYEIKQAYLSNHKMAKFLNNNDIPEDEKSQIIAPAVKSMLSAVVINDLSIFQKMAVLALWILSILISIYYCLPFIQGMINQIEQS